MIDDPEEYDECPYCRRHHPHPQCSAAEWAPGGRAGKLAIEFNSIIREHRDGRIGVTPEFVAFQSFGVLPYRIGDWQFSVFFDGGIDDPDYVDSAVAPDGTELDFDDITWEVHNMLGDWIKEVTPRR